MACHQPKKNQYQIGKFFSMNIVPWCADLRPGNEDYAITIVDRMLAAAVAEGASDVHLHPRGDHWEILFRLDGVLCPLGQVPKSELTDPVARLMVLANIPSYRAGQPMEGRIAKTIGDVEMRLGTFPTVHGIRAVVRLFAASNDLNSIDRLSLPVDIAADLVRLSAARDGAVLLTGPAGSGKTTTLYACLRHIAAANPRRSVLTIEDPIESVIDSISQSQLNTATGMTLAASLRSAVRQDPEVLLVSEVRDVETADAVLVTALTGHLVFSSLHASDVATALRRLSQMELPTYLLRSGLRAVCSQRLLRRLAPEPNETSRYQGRIAIAECVRFDQGEIGEAMMNELASGRSTSQIRRIAEQAGMISLRQRAWQLVEQKITDENEVYRVLGCEAGA